MLEDLRRRPDCVLGAVVLALLVVSLLTVAWPQAPDDIDPSLIAHTGRRAVLPGRVQQTDAIEEQQHQCGHFLLHDDRAILYSGLSPDGLISASGISLASGISISFVASSASHLWPAGRQGPTVSAFIGNRPSEWIVGVQTWTEIVIVDVWPGINLTCQGTSGGLKYEWNVAPGADPSLVRLAFGGAYILYPSPDGRTLTVTGAGCNLTDTGLVAWTDDGQDVEVAWQVDGLEASLSVAAYDTRQALTIDPLIYSTYLGGSGNEYAYDVAALGSDTWVCGSTTSTNFPATGGAYNQTKGSGSDAFVARYDRDGDLVWATYLGGNANGELTGNDLAYSIDVLPNGSSYVVGDSDSWDYPTTPGSENLPDADELGYGFLSRLSPSGAVLEYSTQLGKDGGGWGVGSYPRAVAVAANCTAYVGGWGEVPVTTGAYNTTYNAAINDGKQAWICAVRPISTTWSANLVYGTFLAGWDDEEVTGLSLTEDGHALYATGWTKSENYPTTVGAYQEDIAVAGTASAFVSALICAGGGSGDLVASTFVHGTANATQAGAVYANSTAVVVALTTADNAMETTLGAYDDSLDGNNDVYVAALSADLTAITWGTYVGGSASDSSPDIAVDGTRVAVVFDTTSTDIDVSVGAINSSYGGGSSDICLAVLEHDGTHTGYVTYLAGTGDDLTVAIAANSSFALPIAGCTDSSDFPVTPGAEDGTVSADDAFVMVLAGLVDVVAPNVRLSSARQVESGEYYDVLAFAEDDGVLMSVWAYFSWGDTVALSNSSGPASNFSGGLLVSGISSGYYTIEVWARDGSWNLNSTGPLAFYVDGSPSFEEVNYTSEIRPGDALVVTAQVTDVLSDVTAVRMYIGGDVVDLVQEEYESSWWTGAIVLNGSGDRQFFFRAWDETGKSTRTPDNYTIIVRSAGAESAGTRGVTPQEPPPAVPVFAWYLLTAVGGAVVIGLVAFRKQLKLGKHALTIAIGVLVTMLFVMASYSLAAQPYADAERPVAWPVETVLAIGAVLGAWVALAYAWPKFGSTVGGLAAFSVLALLSFSIVGASSAFSTSALFAWAMVVMVASFSLASLSSAGVGGRVTAIAAVGMAIVCVGLLGWYTVVQAVNWLYGPPLSPGVS